MMVNVLDDDCYLMMKVILVKEVMSCDISPMDMFSIKREYKETVSQCACAAGVLQARRLTFAQCSAAGRLSMVIVININLIADNAAGVPPIFIGIF